MSQLTLVLSCHRSGSSLVARSLKCLGVELSARAVWSAPDNPTGFWEHQDVLSVNEAVLRVCGGTWQAPPSGTQLKALLDRQQPDLMYLRGFAEHTLRLELDRSPLFGLKEPRLCVTKPFWLPVFSALDCGLSVVYVVRHPAAVAASLKARNGMSEEDAFALWMRYYEGAVEWQDEGIQFHCVMADEMVSLPGESIRRLGMQLDLPVNENEVRAFRSGFIGTSRLKPPPEMALPLEVNITWQKLKAMVEY